jgi:hypothetical protein
MIGGIASDAAGAETLSGSVKIRQVPLLTTPRALTAALAVIPAPSAAPHSVQGSS